jgi:hypothetical protein
MRFVGQNAKMTDSASLVPIGVTENSANECPEFISNQVAAKQPFQEMFNAHRDLTLRRKR